MRVNKYQCTIIFALNLLCAIANAMEKDFITVQCKSNFTETMVHLQEVLLEHGFHALRAQKVDVGLRNHGYVSDSYRVVFFSKPKEIESLKNSYPILIPFLPHKITIYVDNDQTVINTIKPMSLGKLFSDPKIQKILSHWDQDMRSIMDDVGACFNVDI